MNKSLLLLLFLTADFRTYRGLGVSNTTRPTRELPGKRYHQRRLFVPADLAYGSQQRGPIPANSTLIFEVELLEIG